MSWPPAPKPECPHCGSADTELQGRTVKQDRYFCNGCSKEFTINTGAWPERTPWATKKRGA